MHTNHCARSIFILITLCAAHVAYGSEFAQREIVGKWKGILLKFGESYLVELEVEPGTQRAPAVFTLARLDEAAGRRAVRKPEPVSFGCTLLVNETLATIQRVIVPPGAQGEDQGLARMVGEFDPEGVAIVLHERNSPSLCILKRPAQADKLLARIRKFTSSPWTPGIGAGTSPVSRTNFAAWLSPLISANRGVPLESMGVDSLFLKCLPYFQDPHFSKHFGQSFEALSMRQLQGINRMTSSPDVGFHHVHPATQFFRSGYAEIIIAHVIASQYLRSWIGALPERAQNFRLKLDRGTWLLEIERVASERIAVTLAPNETAQTLSRLKSLPDIKPEPSSARPGVDKVDIVPSHFWEMNRTDQQYFSPDSDVRERTFLTSASHWRAYMEIAPNSEKRRVARVIVIHSIPSSSRLDISETFRKEIQQKILPLVAERNKEFGHVAGIIIDNHIDGWFVCNGGGSLYVTQDRPVGVVPFASVSFFTTSTGEVVFTRTDFAGHKYAKDKGTINRVFNVNSKSASVQVYSIDELLRNIRDGATERLQALTEFERELTQLQDQRLQAAKRDLSRFRSMVAGLGGGAIQFDRGSMAEAPSFSQDEDHGRFLQRILQGDFASIILFPDNIAAIRDVSIKEEAKRYYGVRFAFMNYAFREYHLLFEELYGHLNLDWTNVVKTVTLSKRGETTFEGNVSVKVRTPFAERYKYFWEYDGETEYGQTRRDFRSELVKFLRSYPSPDSDAVRLFELNLLLLASGMPSAQDMLGLR